MSGPRFDYAAPPVPLAELGAVHVVAIGGAGMSAVARLLLAAGAAVSGSDAQDSATLAALAAEGARVAVGHDPAHLRQARTVVVSSAVREDNVELAAARAAGLRVLHRSQALASVMAGRQRVAVAGANGKTTTAAMLTSALVAAGADPSYAIGGELVEQGTNAHLGSGPAFVVEADESDGSFLAYRPQVAVVTNIQPDHLDHYGTFAALTQAYARFAASVLPGGLVVACADDPGSRELAQARRDAGQRVLTYGQAPDADLRLTDVVASGPSGRARLAGRAAVEPADLLVPMPGVHNLLDAAGAYLAATAGLHAGAAEVVRGLADYRGTRRRFEVKGSAGGVTVVDDYAHNPGKVSALVRAARGLVGEGRLVVVFQPHLYSRTRDFAAEFGAGLAAADVVVVLDVYAAREDPVPGVSGELVAVAVGAARAGCEVHYVPQRERAAEAVSGLVRDGDLLLVVGAGDVTTIGPQVLAALEGRR